MDNVITAITLRGSCPDCGVKRGKRHKDFCDVDHCMNCGMQLLAGCCETPIGKNIWTGIWPGTLECAIYSLYAKLENGQWIKTTADDLEGTENLNEIYSGKYHWDKQERLWVPNAKSKQSA